MGGVDVLAVGHLDMDGIGIRPSVVDECGGNSAIVVGAAGVCYVNYIGWW